MTFKLLHCLCFVLFEGVVLSMPAPTKLVESNIPEWDYFLFVEQSPGGVCYFEKGNNCEYPSNVTTWTMHGIWPTLNGTLGPNWCDPQATFALDKIEGILPQVVRQWPNLKTNTPFASFWSHEWLKHGTCAAAVSSMQTENEFFSTVLGLHEKPMNFTALLSSQGVHPSYNHTFRTDDFNNAFMKTMGVMPLLECLYSKDMGQVLFQVSVCLRKDFSVMPCAPYVFSSSRSRCWDDQDVRYIPKDTPL